MEEINSKTHEDGNVLYKASIRLAPKLSISTDDLSTILKININETNSISPESDAGKKALALIWLYKNLYSNINNDEDAILWMTGYNEGTLGIPAKQILDEEGFDKVLGYLEFMKAK